MKYGDMDDHLEAVNCDCQKHHLEFWISRIKVEGSPKSVLLVSEATLKAFLDGRHLK